MKRRTSSISEGLLKVRNDKICNETSPISPHLYATSVWVEPDTTAPGHTVALILPTSVNARASSTHVSGDGNLSYSVSMWSNPLSDLKYVHKCGYWRLCLIKSSCISVGLKALNAF